MCYRQQQAGIFAKTPFRCQAVPRWTDGCGRIALSAFLAFLPPSGCPLPYSLVVSVSSKGAHAKTRGAFPVISSGLIPADRPLDRCYLLPALILSHICGHFRSGKGQAVKQVWLVVTCYYSFYQRGRVTWEECSRVLGRG